MEILGPACNLRINDNPDNWDIQKEMDAINEDTPDWDKDIGEGLFMGKPFKYWMELDNHAHEAVIEDVVLEKAKLRKRITIWEKRWKALRMYLIGKPWNLYIGKPWNLYIGCEEFEMIRKIMTEITRKIK